jgi:ABC-type proline/glycine betaine transport system permease subunit
MEKGRIMILQYVIIGVLLCLFMIIEFGQNQVVTENLSILLAAVIFCQLILILFGHRLPTSRIGRVKKALQNMHFNV